MNNNIRIKIEKRIIKHYLRALVNNGYTLQVNDGGEDMPITTDVKEATEQITAVDQAHVFVVKGEYHGRLFFVLGNNPGEVLNDYTTALEPIIDEVYKKHAERWA